MVDEDPLIRRKRTFSNYSCLYLLLFVLLAGPSFTLANDEQGDGESEGNIESIPLPTLIQQGPVEVDYKNDTESDNAEATEEVKEIFSDEKESLLKKTVEDKTGDESGGGDGGVIRKGKKSTTTVKPEPSEKEENGTTTPAPAEVLPPKGNQEEEHKNSMAIFFILFVIVLSVMLVHGLITFKIHYVPESLAIVCLGAFIGFILKFSQRDWSEEEAFSPNAFFLILLPPIIFEGGYNLHKGNFFANIGSILVFAIVGTLISAIVVGGGIYILGQADLIYELSAVESFAFGSMISAVDPVATLAIFAALKVDPMLYMLVFGESMLNDAVAIVLTNTVLELRTSTNIGLGEALISTTARFNAMFFGSAALGLMAALLSALLLKHVDLRKTPSLEFGIMLVFAYLPYGLAEGLHLSGIMAILFCGIAMSHYTHLNLSPMTQITMQQTFRTLAFISETCVFAYLGMAFFTFPLNFKPVFIIWGVVSLRGAIAFALSMHMEFDNQMTRSVMITSTLVIVLFTVLVLGGSTMPLMKFLESMQQHSSLDLENGGGKRKRRKRKRSRSLSKQGRKPTSGGWSLSKTAELGSAVEAESYGTDSGGAGSAGEASMRRGRSRNASGTSGAGSASAMFDGLRGLAHIDATYVRPFFVRKFTKEEKKESALKLTDLALQWFQDMDEDSGDNDGLFNGNNNTNNNNDSNDGNGNGGGDDDVDDEDDVLYSTNSQQNNGHNHRPILLSEDQRPLI